MSEKSSDVPRESARTILLQFVVFPLVVVAIGVGVFLLFGSLASEREEIPSYLGAIQSGSSTRRWQAAYQLAMAIQRGEASSHPNLAQDVISIYQDSGSDDPRVRRYLAMVLGKLGDPRAVPVLTRALDDPDPETRLYAVLALAEIGDSRAAPRIQDILQRSDDAALRKSAAYALGRLGAREAIPSLRSALQDPVADVRFNAALALASLEDPSGLGTLRRMVDRSELAAIPEIREDQIEEIMIQAIPAYRALAPEEARPPLTALAGSDPSLRVRAAARAALAAPAP
ncbi:MAG TPA: HEAT repeat domain-containing protein [Thermoanaerobaculia bacterium]|nr:HEAT repeat domain-containing protein [Thermoanaerobaculia bacterium]